MPAEKPEIKGFRQTTTDETTNAIKVSLQDCLACSGCVTTAETMLLQHQSTDELLSKLEDASVTVVASVSHQSIASLAAHYDLPMHAVRPHRRYASVKRSSSLVNMYSYRGVLPIWLLSDECFGQTCSVLNA